ncbi:hypothetical protein BHM03_00010774 [Ensete ventricosum]|nr:hypothetical protein BHM03_00010774 [Ensete ventricosum]
MMHWYKRSKISRYDKITAKALADAPAAAKRFRASSIMVSLIPFALGKGHPGLRALADGEDVDHAGCKLMPGCILDMDGLEAPLGLFPVLDNADTTGVSAASHQFCWSPSQLDSVICLDKTGSIFIPINPDGWVLSVLTFPSTITWRCIKIAITSRASSLPCSVAMSCEHLCRLLLTADHLGPFVTRPFRAYKGEERDKDKRMAGLKAFICFTVALLLFLAGNALATAGAAAAGGESGSQLPLGWIPYLSGCRGTVAECVAGDEFDLGSEVTRRILATSRYISYNALRRDTVPCSRRGASYYNCRPGAQANPYSRSCSAITRCRG